MQEERELKLEFGADDLARLKRSTLFGARKDRTCETLTSVYFDTPKHRLARDGFSLRVRQKGDGFVQTLKARGPAAIGIHSRSEWEWPLPDATPDLAVLKETPLAERAARRGFGGKIAPIFETKVERTTRQITRGDAEVELALDEGVVVAGARSAPIYSLELELKRGPAEALFALARMLPRSAALDLDVRSKSERGYALLGGEPPRSFKAEPVAIDPHETAGAAARLVVKSCLRQFRLNVPGILEREDSEALHQARVAIRRCRSALSFFEPVLGDDAFEDHAAALRDLSGLLGRARDLDVFLDADLPDLAAPLREKAEAERTRRYAALEARLTSPEHRGLLLSLVAWIEQGAWTLAAPSEQALPIRRFAAARLELWRRKVKKRGRDLAALPAQERHEARIAAKKMRYACEFLASTVEKKPARKRARAFMAALEELQKDLGALNDRAFGQDLIVDLGGTAAAPAGSDDAETDVASIAGAERAYAVFCKAKPFWA